MIGSLIHSRARGGEVASVLEEQETDHVRVQHRSEQLLNEQ